MIAGLGAELLVRHSAEEWLPLVHHSAGEKQVPSALLLLVVVVVVVVVAPCRLLLSAGDKQHKPPFTFTFASNTNNDRRCKSIVCVAVYGCTLTCTQVISILHKGESVTRKKLVALETEEMEIHIETHLKSRQ